MSANNSTTRFYILDGSTARWRFGNLMHQRGVWKLSLKCQKMNPLILRFAKSKPENNIRNPRMSCAIYNNTWGPSLNQQSLLCCVLCLHILSIKIPYPIIPHSLGTQQRRKTEKWGASLLRELGGMEVKEKHSSSTQVGLIKKGFSTWLRLGERLLLHSSSIEQPWNKQMNNNKTNNHRHHRNLWRTLGEALTSINQTSQPSPILLSHPSHTLHYLGPTPHLHPHAISLITPTSLSLTNL